MLNIYFVNVTKFSKVRFKGGYKNICHFKGGLFYKGATTFPEDLRGRKHQGVIIILRGDKIPGRIYDPTLLKADGVNSHEFSGVQIHTCECM